LNFPADDGLGCRLKHEGLEVEMKNTLSRKQYGRMNLASAGCAILVAIFLIAAGCSENASEKHAADAKRQGSPKPVTVAEAVEKAIPVELRAVGAVEAYATVTVKAQVEGEVTAVHLQEGQCVETGDLLFTIDPRPFEVRLKQVQADLARDKAHLENAHTLLERNASVVTKGYVSQGQYDQAVADAAALEATVRADEAAVENAKIQLAYCSIRSPITGCAGEVFVDRGNVVKANDADHPLVVIRQIRPIYVGFSVPERYLPDVRKYSAAGELIVLAAPAGHGGEPIKGELTFVDNSINTATGTILLKATFANAAQALWPGQFVNVTLQLASQPGAVVAASRAVQTGQDGQYVFVLKPDHTVEYRPVTVDRTVGAEAVIAKGLQPGDKVVTDGQLQLFPGATVKIVAGLQDQETDSKP
jgi:multidrug efflux system membrane fusion protein